MKDKYCAAACRTRCKKDNNEYLATHTRKGGQILTLDGADMRTAKVLKDHGHPYKNQWVPNNTDSYHEIKKKITNCFHKTMLNFLRTLKGKVMDGIYIKFKKALKFAGAYLDYCGAFNREAKEAITILFSAGLMEHKSALGMTHNF